MGRKKSSIGCLFWTALVLLVLVIFLFNRGTIETVVEKTGLLTHLKRNKPSESELVVERTDDPSGEAITDSVPSDPPVAVSEETSADFLQMMNSMGEKNKNKKTKPAKDGTGKPGRWTTFLFETFNPAHWLTGPATITEFDPSNGRMIMEIPDCGWHTCARPETLPNPNALPEEGCLLICKGPFEAMFRGENGGLKMEFDPHLPETSCTVRMSWATS